MGTTKIKATSVATAMWWAVFALLFPAAAGIYFFGIQSFFLIISTVLISVIAEALFQFFSKQKITVNDGSAVVTGLLLALILPPQLPIWIGGIGAVFAIVIVKGLFGGLGFNVFNPALAARGLLLLSWPLAMTTWYKPFEAITTATPLYLAKGGMVSFDYYDLFIGFRAGSIGETSSLAILIGAAILFYKKIISWPTPIFYILTVALFTFILGEDPIFYILSGGLLIGAFFMATDAATVPKTILGRIIFGFGAGFFTVIIRFFGTFPEGVTYSILIMNMLTPLLDKYLWQAKFGVNE